MPPSISAFSRAALPMLALAASVPTGAAAQAPVSPTVSPQAVVSVQPVAGGASLSGSQTKAPRLVRILARDLTFTRGGRVSVRLRALGSPVSAELRVGSAGRKVADGVANAGRRVKLEGTAAAGEKLRLVVRRTDGGVETSDIAIGAARRKLNLRPTVASWYGPGLFGNRTACGQTLTRGLRGVAHKTLPCGTPVTVKYRGRSTRAKVVDRGPFHASREFDLTYATAQAIGFNAVGRVYVSH